MITHGLQKSFPDEEYDFRLTLCRLNQSSYRTKVIHEFAHLLDSKGYDVHIDEEFMGSSTTLVYLKVTDRRPLVE